MRYVIYGAGAIGATIGGLLAVAGTDTTLVARGAHLDALQRDGLTLRWPSERDQRIEVRAVGTASDAGIDDTTVVILAVKSQDTPAALDDLAATGAAPRIVCAQNGVDNERQALRLFEHVYGQCLFLPTTHLRPGVVEVRAEPVPGVVDVGRYPFGIDGVAEAVAADLTAAGFASEARPAIMARKYRKLLANLANVVDAVAGPAGADSPIVAAARREANRCFEVAGIQVASEDEDRARRAALVPSGRPFAAGGPSSSWQSLARGAGRIESDFLNGEVVLLGRLHGVEVPVNTWLAGLGRRLARTGAPAGSLDLAALEEEAAAAGWLADVSRPQP
jgi:2-dehydropantoate 2-reductase